MKRYIIDYDDSQQPPAGTKATPSIVSGLMDYHKKGSRILEKKNSFVYPSSNQITVKQDTVISLFNSEWRSFIVDTEATLGATDLDTGSAFVVGTDYYIYLIDDGEDGILKISANSTFPLGQSADNTRKIGGFHFGHVRCTNDKFAPISPNGTVFGSDGVGWKNNVVVGIIPNSVWDLNNRPLCSPEGMALVGNIWVDIYQSSAAEAITFEDATNGLFVGNGKLQSKYGQLPVTGTEGCHWFSFNELAARSGKRLLSYGEWIRAAYGNPGGQDAADDYGWTKTSNAARARVGCQVNAAGAYDPANQVKKFAVSAHNLCDTVGNVWEWVDETSIYDGGSTTGAWNDVLGTDKGQIYEYTPLGLHAFICGGYWGDGVPAGSRAVHLHDQAWYVGAGLGVRLACDKLAG